jgi:hypothetical protein
VIVPTQPSTEATVRVPQVCFRRTETHRRLFRNCGCRAAANLVSETS